MTTEDTDDRELSIANLLNALVPRFLYLEDEVRRLKGIPKDKMVCGICHHEIESDRYEFDENAFACDPCYNSKPEVRQDVREWEQLKQA